MAEDLHNNKPSFEGYLDHGGQIRQSRWILHAQEVATQPYKGGAPSMLNPITHGFPFIGNAQKRLKQCRDQGRIRSTAYSFLQSVFTPPLLAIGLNALRQALHVNPFTHLSHLRISEGWVMRAALRTEERMLDVLDIVITLLLLSLSLAYVTACDRLKGNRA